MKSPLLHTPLSVAVLALLTLLSSSARAELDFHPGKRVRLANGRYIHYAEYGVPTGNLVLYFHGTPGSHLEVGLCYEELEESGIRLISISRPGVSNSTYYGCRRITDWPSDIDQMLSAMGLEGVPFGVVALSGGAPYGLAVARAMPDRVTHLALVSGHTPPGVPVVRGNSDNMIDLIRRRPRLGRLGIGLIDRRLNRKPESIVKQVTKSWTAADRKLVLCNPKLKKRLVANLKEATVCGPQGLAKDISLLGSCWGFSGS